MMTNLKLHTFLKHAGCPSGGGGGAPNLDNDRERGKGGKKT